MSRTALGTVFGANADAARALSLPIRVYAPVTSRDRTSRIVNGSRMTAAAATNDARGFTAQNDSVSLLLTTNGNEQRHLAAGKLVFRNMKGTADEERKREPRDNRRDGPPTKPQQTVCHHCRCCCRCCCRCHCCSCSSLGCGRVQPTACHQVAWLMRLQTASYS